MSVSYSLWRDIFKKCCHAKAFKIQNDPTRSASLINLFGLGRVVHFGAGDEARTRYLHLGKVALYQMSYARGTVSTIADISPFVKGKFTFSRRNLLQIGRRCDTLFNTFVIFRRKPWPLYRKRSPAAGRSRSFRTRTPVRPR